VSGKLKRRLAIREGIGGGAHNRNINVRRVEGKLAKVGHRENAEASADNRFAVTESPRAVCRDLVTPSLSLPMTEWFPESSLKSNIGNALLSDGRCVPQCLAHKRCTRR
jgi:hypothetical protein